MAGPVVPVTNYGDDTAKAVAEALEVVRRRKEEAAASGLKLPRGVGGPAASETGQIQGPVDPKAMPVNLNSVPREDGSGWELNPVAGSAPRPAPAPPNLISLGESGPLDPERQEIFEKGQASIDRSKEAAELGAKYLVETAREHERQAQAEEAGRRRLQAADEKRREAMARDFQERELQASQMASLELAAGRFFADQEKFNTTVLAAGLARAGFVDQAMGAIRDSIGREYNYQKNAIDAARMRGERVNNTLSRLRDIYQDEKTADLTFEQLSNEIAAKKLKAMATQRQGEVNQKTVESMALKAESEWLEAKRMKVQAERRKTLDPQEVAISNQKFLQWKNDLMHTKAPTGASAGNMAASGGAMAGAIAGGSVGKSQAASSSAPQQSGSSIAGSPTETAIKDFRKGGRSQLTVSTKVVPSKSVPGQSVQVLIPPNMNLVKLGSSPDHYLLNQKQSEAVNEKLSKWSFMKVQAGRMERAINAMQEAEKNGYVNSEQRLMIQKELEAAATELSSSWWQGLVSEGVLQKEERESATQMFGAGQSPAQWALGIANQAFGAPGTRWTSNWANALTAGRAAVNHIKGISDDSYLQGWMRNQGLSRVQRSTEFSYDEQGNIVPPQKGREIYTVVTSSSDR